MKNLRTAVLCALMALTGISAIAQNKRIPINEPDYNKPRLFTNLPDKIQVSTNDLESYFSDPLGSHTRLNLTNDLGLKFEGDLVSISSRSVDGAQTAIVRSTNYNGARFTITKKENPDGSSTYIGRIISFQHGDLYELQNLQGQWYLVKRNYYDLVNE
jgi:hypothetical protein